MKRILLALAATFLTVGAVADDQNSPQKGQFYIAPGAVGYHAPDASSMGYEDMDIGPGIIFGYGLSDNWSIEALVSQVESDFENPAGSGEDDATLRWVDFAYGFSPYKEWRPFVLFGGGRTKFNFEGVRSSARDNQYNIGAGVYRQLTDSIALRADVRGVSSTKVGGLEPFAFIGLTGFIGEGRAPLPPADSDGDGVPNETDQCPTTPAGRTVDATGCELDGDNDGVVDGADDCLETPAGTAVDSKGCALDADGDGVPDYKDECPDSEAGAKVNDRGCYIELEEGVTIDMNIEFATNKADIRDDHVNELNRAVRFLKEYPTTQAVIEGHTDSDGAASYNQNLSEQRSKAVYEYLINEAGISEARLTWAGFGETQPIESNDSAAGKQSNRRVTAVVTGTHKVRQ